MSTSWQVKLARTILPTQYIIILFGLLALLSNTKLFRTWMNAGTDSKNCCIAVYANQQAIKYIYIGFQYIKATGASNYIYSFIMTTSYDPLFTSNKILTRECLHRGRTQSRLPQWAALCRGVQPSRVRALGSAPCWSSSCDRDNVNQIIINQSLLKHMNIIYNA